MELTGIALGLITIAWCLLNPPPMTLQDHFRHFYYIGKTGCGKSTAIRSNLINWIKKGYGAIVIETKDGSTIDDIINCIPEQLHEKVIVFDPLDMDQYKRYIGLNLLQKTGRIATEDILVCGEVLSNLKRMFGEGAIQARSEDIIRNATLACLEMEKATLLEPYMMLTNKEFRESLVERIQNYIVKDYYQYEFEDKPDILQAPKNKLRAFMTNPLIRLIMAQYSGLDMRKIMDEQKILLVCLPKGIIGEDTMRLLAGTILSKSQLAAQSRADMPKEERFKVPVMIVADEFQDYANTSFNAFLEQARAFGVSLVISHQLMTQQGVPPSMVASIRGNVKNFYCFQVGVDDAPVMATIFKEDKKEQRFDAYTLANLREHSYIEKISINGRQQKPRLRCNPYPKFLGDYAGKIRRDSVMKYGIPLKIIDDGIKGRLDDYR